MIISKQLNLVLPVTREDQTVLYVHSRPIRSETFDTYWLVLSKTFSEIAQNGLMVTIAPSVAARVLQDVSQATYRAPGITWWEGQDGVGGPAGLLAEMARLSMAVVATPDKGWTTVPLQQAYDQGLVDDEERSEIRNILTFFTLASRVAPKLHRPGLLAGMQSLYRAQTTSLSDTEYAASLKTSSEDASITETAPA